jgi:hypothetical protein
MNRLAFDKAVAQQPSLCGDLDITLLPSEEEEVTRPSSLPAGELENIGDVSGTRAKLQSQIYLCQPQVVDALARIHLECDKAAALSLFNTHVTKAVRLDEFRSIQTLAFDGVKTYLRNTWAPESKKALVGSLAKFGKGWFNLKEQTQEVGQDRLAHPHLSRSSGTYIRAALFPFRSMIYPS